MNVSYLKAKSTTVRTEESARVPGASCFLPPPSTPPRRYLLRFGDCLNNRIGTIRVTIRTPAIRPIVFLVGMCHWHPRMIVQTGREGESPQECQPPELAVWLVLRVSISKLDLRTTGRVSLGSPMNSLGGTHRCSTATISQIPNRFRPWPADPTHGHGSIFGSWRGGHRLT